MSETELDGEWVVDSVMEGGPAQLGGIREGSVVVQVDGMRYVVVCMYVCVNIYIYIYIYIYIHIHTYVCGNLHTYIHIYIHTYTAYQSYKQKGANLKTLCAGQGGQKSLYWSKIRKEERRKASH